MTVLTYLLVLYMVIDIVLIGMSMDAKLKITEADVVYVGGELGVPVKIKTEEITYVGTSEYVPKVLEYSLECAKVKRDIKGQGILENLVLVLPVIMLLLISGILIDRHMPVKNQVEVGNDRH